MNLFSPLLFSVSLLFAALPSSVFANSKSLPEVIFFGGAGATDAQMKEWEEAAKKAPKGKSYIFRGQGYPVGADSSAKSAVQKGEAQLKALADEINAHPEKRYILAGHSSGSALSNRLAGLIKDTRKIKLVALDGFAPSNELQEKLSTDCWYAVNPETKLLSRNADSIIAKCKTKKAYEERGCATAMCLHMSLVRKRNGRGLNLDWLTEEPPLSSEARGNPEKRGAVR